MKMHKSDLYMLICCSIRYAAGRQSYISAWASEMVKDHFKDLSEVHKEPVIAELEEAAKLSKGIDKESFQQTADLLRKKYGPKQAKPIC